MVGATGPTGQLVVEQLLARDHAVVAYVRRPEALAQASGLTIVAGELTDTATFAAAIAECDVIVSTLGSRSMMERSFMTRHLPLVVDAMLAAKVPRLVLMSALGGGEIPKLTTGVSRSIFSVMSKRIFADRTISEAALDTRGVQWCGVYPGFLNNTSAASEVDVVDVDEMRDFRGGSVSRANVAAVIVQLVEDPASSGRRLVVAPHGTVKR